MRAGIGQIAIEAGVDKSTVSRVLSGKADAARISPRRAAHVRRVARTLGYRPNLAARSISTGRFCNVLFIHGTRQFTSGLSWDVLAAAHDALANAGHHLTYARLPDKQLTDRGYVPHFLQHWMCDGLLINYIAGVPDRMVALIRAHGLPSVWINVKAATDCVHPDDGAAGAMVAKRLLELGHRRIAYADRALHKSAAAGHQHYSKPDRLAGCRQEIEKAGLRLDLWSDADWPDAGEAGFMFQRLMRRDRPTAVIGYSEPDMRACVLAAARAGLRIPEELSLASFGGATASLSEEIGLSLAVEPDRDVGAQAVRMLLEKIQRQAVAHPALAVPYAWREGRTMARPELNSKRTTPRRALSRPDLPNSHD